MKGFIEIHTKEGTPHLVNTRHITEVIDSTVYTDDILPDGSGYPHISCLESYEEIRDKIERATE